MIRRLTKDEWNEFMEAAKRHGHWIDWQWIDELIGDPCVLGAYAKRRVMATRYKYQWVTYEGEP